MKHLWFLSAAMLLAPCVACSKKEEPKNAAHVATPAKPVSPWVESVSTDAMTDVTRYSLSTFDKSVNGSFSIMCDDESESAFFASPLFLGTGKKSSVMIRYDNDKATDEDAFLTKRVALLRDPKKPGSFKTEPIEKFLLELSAHVFFLNLKGHAHHRLRVRLTSFDGETEDLDFNIAGLQTELADIEKKCGIQPQHVQKVH